MSGESSRHVRLVEMLIATVETRHGVLGNVVVFADHPRFGNDRPVRIGGYTPDVYASDVPATFRILGEAKTPNDLETDRSLRQISAFLDHLCLYEGSVFYLAVPWVIAPRARGIIRRLKRGEHEPVHIEVIPCFLRAIEC